MIALPTPSVLPLKSKATGQTCRPPREQKTQPAGVVGEDAVQGPAGLVAAVVEIGRAVAVVRRPGVERVGDQEVDARDLHVVGPPLHLAVGQVLAPGAEDFDHGPVVGLAEGVRDGTGQLGGLPGRLIADDALGP